MSWEKPTEISDVTLAFPANAEKELMPSFKECDDGLAELSQEERSFWLDFQSRWFATGLPETTKFHMKDGIDGETAFRHLSAIQGSFAPKHQHKQVAVAYLASLWIKKVTYE